MISLNQMDDVENITNGQVTRSPLTKRTQSSSPAPRRKEPLHTKTSNGRRCQSLPSNQIQNKNKCLDRAEFEHRLSAPETVLPMKKSSSLNYHAPDKDNTANSILTKTMRALATKKREFLKSKKNLITHQNSLIEQYATLKDLETRAGVKDDGLSEMRLLSIKGWSAYDLLLLVRDDLQVSMNSEISGFGQQVLEQIQAQLNPIPDDVRALAVELIRRREDILNILRNKHRNDRSTYVTNLEWKAKNQELDNESENLYKMTMGMIENLKVKIAYSAELAKSSWMDRNALIKKLERIQKENTTLNYKIEDILKQQDSCKDSEHEQKAVKKQQEVLEEELAKERAAKDSLKEVISSAESMLRIARAKITNLEKLLKDNRVELEATRRKYKDLEQLYRYRESSYDVRSKKLLEASKTGEMTIDALSKQRDALEFRVKELREQAEEAELAATARNVEQQHRTEILQAKVAEQEKNQKATEDLIHDLEAQNKNLEEQLQNIRERSLRLADLERQHCLQYVPSKESEPSDRETELWKELQVTRMSLVRAEEELRQSRAERDDFLNSLAKIAKEERGEQDNKLATELLNKEKRIIQLQEVIDELKMNEKIMEQGMTEYENQLAALRLEVRRLRNYDCYGKEIPFQDMHTELLTMHLQVEKLSRERAALANAAASRALMLERHERSADLFASITRARRELVAHLEGQIDPPMIDSSIHAEISRSLTSVCNSAADTWSALRAERSRVLRLESAVLSQGLQLEREERVRTQLERRRAILEREILRTKYAPSSHSNVDKNYEF